MKSNFTVITGLAFLVLVGATLIVYRSREPLTRADQTSQSRSNFSVGEQAQTFANATRPIVGASSIRPQTPVPIVWAGISPTTRVIKHDSRAALSGEAAVALVQDGKGYDELVPNQVGEFDQIRVAPRSLQRISLAYPSGYPGDVVSLEIEDGGTINGKGFAATAKLGEDRQIHFNFAVNQEEGVYRVMARNGSDVKMLNFWVTTTD